MPIRELTAGQTIAERYRLIALRGSGGMGSVWRAIHLPDATECALKILHRAPPHRAVLGGERFLREVRAASSIESPNAVRVLDYGIDADVPFIAMELLEGETLANRLQSTGRISPLETSRIIGQVASALERAHEVGIVHRDLKPDNIFLAQTERGVVAKVLDFGIAKMADDEALARDLTETGALLGTPHYMSPEQVEGARYVDQRADLWSLGVITFECITGERPFKGDGLRALFAAICSQPAPTPSALCSVPRGFDAWFTKTTQKDPGRRFRAASALATELRHVCEQELSATPTVDDLAVDPESASEAASRAQPAALARRTSGRGRAVRWVLASAVVVAAAGWLSARWVSAAPPRESANQKSSLRVAAAPPAPARVPEILRPTDVFAAPSVPAAPPAITPKKSEVRATRSVRPMRASQPPAGRIKRPPPVAGTASRAPATADQPKRWDIDVLLGDRK